ncbi:MAG TPA: sialidase family protein [Candidatus Hydrogenedentes bacterium]|nr:sialidase family protein [Candidatus Hydrogenedentota bacterium]HOL78380.1 sialidase family protein [Candidatus Hydrogenedentota bacterium]HPO87201.1 sialidase family protein [Candidatus Hydrogenedentota bacterium]
MQRREFLQSILAGSTMIAAVEQKTTEITNPIPIVADETIVYESPDPATVYAYSPGLAILPNGRLVATMDQGGPGTLTRDDIPRIDGRVWRGRIYTSDDHGKTWQFRGKMPLEHARPFVAGDTMYVLGHDNDLGVMKSADGGTTWTGPYWLTKGETWHQAPCNVWYTRGRIYLVMEKVTKPDFPHWPVAVLAPVLMSADVHADLALRENWTFSNEYSYKNAIEEAGKPNLIGVPFFTPGYTTPESEKNPRPMSPPGWLETNVVQFYDPNHVWYDDTGRTFYLWMRAHTGSTNLAAIAKAVESEDGKLTVTLARAPSGEPMLYVPCPGGQMKFHILYDDVTKLFWLLSSQATDSMTRPDRLPENRYNLPNNERHRLVLHFSKNCMDWCFAGRIADTGEYGQGRHYASMVIDNDDLHVLSRSGDSRAKSAHDGNLITFHTVRKFRNLVY